MCRVIAQLRLLSHMMSFSIAYMVSLSSDIKDVPYEFFRFAIACVLHISVAVSIAIAGHSTRLHTVVHEVQLAYFAIAVQLVYQLEVQPWRYMVAHDVQACVR